MIKILLSMVIVLSSDFAAALIQIPDGTCSLQGRAWVFKDGDVEKTTLEINEESGAGKVITLRGATDSRLKEAHYLGNTVEIKLRIKDDEISGEATAEFISLVARVPSFSVKHYVTEKDFAEVCVTDRQPQSKPPAKTKATKQSPKK